MSYCQRIYGSAAETSLGTIEGVQRRKLIAMFFKTKLDPITDILLNDGIPTVSELYPCELLQELLRHLTYQVFPEKNQLKIA